MRRKFRHTVIALSLLIVVYAAWSVVSFAFRQGRSFEWGSSYRSDKHGARAFYLFLSEKFEGCLKVERLTVPTFSDLPSGVVFWIAQDLEKWNWSETDSHTSGELNKSLEKSAIEWMEKGGRLAVFGDVPWPPSLAGKLGMPFTGGGIIPQLSVTPEAEAMGFTATGGIFFYSEGELFDSTLEPAVPLLAAEGVVNAVFLPVGKGGLYYIGQRNMPTNMGIREPANLTFCTELALIGNETGNVYFAEYIHGVDAGGSYLGLAARYSLTTAMVQLLIAISLALWRYVPRLGPVRERPELPLGRETEFARSVAALYREVNPGRLVGDSIVSEILEKARLRRAVHPAHSPQAFVQSLSALGVPEESARRTAQRYRTLRTADEVTPSMVFNFYLSARTVLEALNARNSTRSTGREVLSDKR
ncbi:MAG: hypothetical protein Kow00107_05840 [Planctomycetota bacterium]